MRAIFSKYKYDRSISIITKVVKSSKSISDKNNDGSITPKIGRSTKTNTLRNVKTKTKSQIEKKIVNEGNLTNKVESKELIVNQTEYTDISTLMPLRKLKKDALLKSTPNKSDTKLITAKSVEDKKTKISKENLIEIREYKDYLDY